MHLLYAEESANQGDHLKMIQLCNTEDGDYLKPISNSDKNLYFSEMFFEQGLIMPTRESFGEALKCFCKSSKTYKLISKESKLKGRMSYEENPLNGLVEMLTEQGYYQSALLIRNNLMISEPNKTIIEPYLRKVFSFKELDCEVAVSLMISLPVETAFNLFRGGLSTIGNDYLRLIKLASIGMACGNLWNQRSFFVDCQQLEKNGIWWYHLNLLEIPFDNVKFRTSKFGEYQKTLIPMILEKSDLDISSVKDYCECFDINKDFAYFEFIQQSIKKREFKGNVLNVIEEIKNKEKLKDLLLNEILNNISPFDYSSKVSLV
ncbi:hypothetical protein ROZALSC1DRAFT_24533 [Rozella allomycis CSF55]|uniref:KNTC1 third ARM-repeats domain-containing protein n=1 Tax=Rozella allomycis (strain CSF55) TaxID=988480 RepID=A0A4P9YCU7_ROZAC|nr:hypothetical protein ROZALSC1DRAFT_24533 [Rozella allomycis CSF55]